MNEIEENFKNLSIDNSDKQRIIKLFLNNVKSIDISIEHSNHCGREGHWLERRLNIKHNNKNEPDLYGFEIKKFSSIISFGDFSASEYLYSPKKLFINKYNEWIDINITRNEYIKYFGTKNEKKINRYSWSGTCIPKYNNWNKCGQNMLFNENNDLCIYYSFDKDKRPNKNELPYFLQTNNIILIAIWKKDKLEKHINNKYNKEGFIIFKKIKNTYQKIYFGKPFIDKIKNEIIYFDSGMHEGNNRNYSQFRSSYSKFWNLLVIEEY